ncbi:hypothetical protein [Sporosarcina sp. FA9]|uniref:hypothetical protein n=1 Tax=Sporosarcina sp. FA9 TaxID=3413030 RepID=UPI003F65DE3B
MYVLKKIGLIALGAILLLLTACTEIPKPTPELEPTPVLEPEPTPELEPQDGQSEEEDQPGEGVPPTALEAATTVLRALKNGDMKTVAAWASRKGVRFSPYAYVDTKTDLVFSRDELEGLMGDPTERIWRTYPGSGDLIELTFKEYYNQFIYDADFMSDAEVSVNEMLGESTTINNLNEVYPKESHNFVEYYIDGFDPVYEGMDWRSLCLVFEKIGDDSALVGIIHNQWTP